MRKLDASKPEISFGSQIRSYVMQPYQMIKDHRTKVERGDIVCSQSAVISRIMTSNCQASHSRPDGTR